MSVELITSISAIVVAIASGIFNYYKLKDDQKTWENEQEISINKEKIFKVLEKRFEYYAKVFRLLGEVRDIDYPKNHYRILQNNKHKLLKIADQVLHELYDEAGLFMSYETRSKILRTYQDTYRYVEEKISLSELIDSYYYARRSLRKDLEFDDEKSSASLKKILNENVYRKEEVDNNKFRWKEKNILAYSPRPGYPDKNVSTKKIYSTIKLWKENKIKSIICLLSEEEIKEYYESIQSELIELYIKNGFNVVHVKVDDFAKPIINDTQLNEIFKGYEKLEKPVLIHCGAGIDRTGFLMEKIDIKYDLKNSTL